MLIPFDQLFARWRIKAKGVLHLGANTGQEAQAYAALGIRRVIWVEALPDIHAKLVQRVRRFPGSVALLACLSDKDGEKVVFNRANNESQSSSFLEFGTHAVEYPATKFIEKIEMDTIRCDTLLRNYGLEVLLKEGDWFLNVDLQGAELLALRGMGDLLWRFAHAYIEVNIKELYLGCPMVEDIDHYLANFGLWPKESKMMGDAGWGDRFYSRL